MQNYSSFRAQRNLHLLLSITLGNVTLIRGLHTHTHTHTNKHACAVKYQGMQFYNEWMMRWMEEQTKMDIYFSVPQERPPQKAANNGVTGEEFWLPRGEGRCSPTQTGRLQGGEMFDEAGRTRKKEEEVEERSDKKNMLLLCFCLCLSVCLSSWFHPRLDLSTFCATSECSDGVSASGRVEASTPPPPRPTHPLICRLYNPSQPIPRSYQ